MEDSGEYRFDSVLLALAEQHKGGVPEVMISNSTMFASNPFSISRKNINCAISSSFSAAGNDCWIFSTKNRFLCRWKRGRVANREYIYGKQKMTKKTQLQY